jgi:hypothetical protein
MIRWTLKKKGNTVALTFRERRRFWTRELLLALLIASLAHVIPLVVFKIDLGMLKDPEPPSTVTLLPSTNPGSVLISEKEAHQKIEMPFLEIRRTEPIAFVPTGLPQESVTYRAPILIKKSFQATPYLSRGISIKNKELSPLQVIAYEPLHASLFFEADPATGIIFFYEWKERSGNAALDKEIETYLKKLTLHIPGKSLARGEIDLQFLEASSS